MEELKYTKPDELELTQRYLFKAFEIMSQHKGTIKLGKKLEHDYTKERLMGTVSKTKIKININNKDK